MLASTPQAGGTCHSLRLCASCAIYFLARYRLRHVVHRYRVVVCASCATASQQCLLCCATVCVLCTSCSIGLEPLLGGNVALRSLDWSHCCGFECTACTYKIHATRNSQVLSVYARAHIYGYTYNMRATRNSIVYMHAHIPFQRCTLHACVCT